MTILTAGNLKAALGALSDAAKAYGEDFANVADDEAVLFDGLQFAAPLIGGAFGVVAPVIGPLVIDALVLAVENNQSATPGALNRIASGRRGSDPWRP